MGRSKTTTHRFAFHTRRRPASDRRPAAASSSANNASRPPSLPPHLRPRRATSSLRAPDATRASAWQAAVRRRLSRRSAEREGGRPALTSSLTRQPCLTHPTCPILGGMKHVASAALIVVLGLAVTSDVAA